MCGIAGWIGSVENGRQVAARMRAQLRHRGPDGSGIREMNKATLVHTRLSIIDVSELGSQPMSCHNGRIWVVLNGEIYNHRALRRSLEQRGHVFRGHSDTEVIPALYLEYGRDFATHLRGMFAIAVFDSEQQRLTLVRDRFGIKPLFYTDNDDRLGFASEVRAVRHLPDVDDRPDLQAIYDYSAMACMAAPRTAFRGVHALEPCARLEAWVDGDRIRYRLDQYHQWAVTPQRGLTLSAAVEQADVLLNQAVERQLESDVPLGSLLSGGIDSSLVSAIAHKKAPPLKTFNVQFPADYDETWAAVSVARHIDSDHRTLAIREGEATWDRVTELLSYTGQPLADTSVFAVNAVSRLMREHVTVALSGDGGDEAFGGYDVFWRLARIASLQRVPGAVWSAATAISSPLARHGLIRPWMPERFSDLRHDGDTAILRHLWSGLRHAQQQELFEDIDVTPTDHLFESRWPNRFDQDADRIERLSAHNTEVSIRLLLADGFLFKVDMASMFEGLEVRVPMLDEDLVSFGLTLPHELKVQGRTCKRILRAIAERELPTQVARKPKAGFAIPVDYWVDASFKERLHDTLLSSSSPLRGLLRRQTYERWIKAFRDGVQLHGITRSGLYNRAILLLSLHLALEPFSTSSSQELETVATAG